MNHQHIGFELPIVNEIQLYLDQESLYEVHQRELAEEAALKAAQAKKGAAKAKKPKKPAAKTQEEIEEENIMKAQIVLTVMPKHRPFFRYIPSRQSLQRMINRAIVVQQTYPNLT
jgi:hypothetical protein